MKRAALISLALCLSACGFTPMHASNGAAAFKNINVDLADGIPIDDREAGFWVRQSLVERLGDKDGATQRLVITPVASRGGLGISGQDIATRYDLRMNVKYELTDVKTGKHLTRGTVSTVSTFSATNDPYALVSAEKTTARQLADQAADQVLTRLASYYAKTK